MKHNKLFKKEPVPVVRCTNCRSDNVYYDAGVICSSWVGGSEVTEAGLYTCLDCNHVWHQAAPKRAAPAPAPEPEEVNPIEPEE